jgi:hypothetical protein
MRLQLGDRIVINDKDHAWHTPWSKGSHNIEYRAKVVEADEHHAEYTGLEVLNESGCPPFVVPDTPPDGGISQHAVDRLIADGWLRIEE